MKITLFTSNQARHCSLIREFAAVADEVFVIQECNTLFPGQVDDFFKKSEVMQDYFKQVQKAEQKIFGSPDFLPDNVRTLSMKMKDLNKVPLKNLGRALESDYYAVFGASYIKGDLIDFLVQKRALNIHMGVSPYYRGSSCTFWALYDNHPELVGATVHYLSKGLDSGEMLFHCLPSFSDVDNLFEYTMKSVKVAHQGLAQSIAKNNIFDIPPVKQDASEEVRYSKNAEFTDEVAKEFLERPVDLQKIAKSVEERDMGRFLRPLIF